MAGEVRVSNGNCPGIDFMAIFRLVIATVGLSAFLSFVPSTSKLSVFRNGEFAYCESVGLFLGYLTVWLVGLYFIADRLGRLELSKRARLLIYSLLTGASLFLLMTAMTAGWIRYDVKSSCQEAKREFGGNCVNSLSAVLKDESKSFRERNSAIWALGMLGDRRALPVLQSYYTGNIPDREPLDGTISQYELKKAVNLTGGGTNFFAVFWRYGINN